MTTATKPSADRQLVRASAGPPLALSKDGKLVIFFDRRLRVVTAPDGTRRWTFAALRGSNLADASFAVP
jgi:hypothetical protein